MVDGKSQKKYFKQVIKLFFNFFGYEIYKKKNFLNRYGDYIVEASDNELENLEKFERLCLASKTNLWSIIQSLQHLKNKNISGDIVECGIYNGCTVAFINKISEHIGLNKSIWGYDTFEKGFLKDTVSKNDYFNIKKKKFDVTNDKTSYYTKEQVINNIKKFSNFNGERIRLIEGNIIETLEKYENIPDKISFLRMDTDIYNTTKKQLEILYPRLTIGGVLHIDDYGWMSGVKDAVDEYFKNKKIWLHRVDLTCRYLIKED